MKTDATPLVSIIVPVYNVEKYVSKCIESLISQSYSNIEIIVINDGSPDNSKDIISKYNKFDSRIKLVNKNNEGVAIARNIGMELARGEYIMFVDSDDYVCIDFVSYFLKLIIDTKSDVAVSLNKFTEKELLQITKDKIEIYDSVKAIENLYLYKIGVAVWNKIWRRDFLLKNNLIFQKFMYYGEGTTFCINAFQFAEKIGVGRRKVLFQRNNNDSATRKFNIVSREHGIQNLFWQREHLLLNDKRILNAWKFHYWRTTCSNLKDLIINRLYNQNKNTYNRYIKIARNFAFYSFLVPTSTKHRFLAVLMYISPRIASIIWHKLFFKF